jgi:hypothetical protein|tara:strand:+ start:616 stop:735 length:120 start_codon:yes stop_codon:yes gene_type:complete
MASSLYGKFYFDARTQGTARSGTRNFESALEGEQIPSSS